VVAGWCVASIEFDTEDHPAVQGIEHTGEIVWLGVRDGFRNWFLIAA
jgi:hypothetical protein